MSTAQAQSPVPHTTVADLQSFERRYTNLPFEASLKQDILRLGLSVDGKALSGIEFKTKDYFIFTFDHVPLAEQSEEIRFRAPEEIRLSGGPFSLAKTVVSVRIDPSSPYRVS